MTLANRITMFRVVMIPVFALLVFYYSRDRDHLRFIALGVYVAAAVSDFLDGFVARRLNQHSKLGARLDPLADKLIVNLGFVLVAANPEFDPGIPLWFPVIILTRDVAIVMGAFLINEYFGPAKVQPRVWGKITTAFPMSAMIAVLLQLSLTPYLLAATLGFTLISMADYVYFGSRQALQRDTV